MSSRSLIKCVVSPFAPDDGSTETLILFAALVLPFRLPFDRTDLPDLPALIELQPLLDGAVEAQVLAMELSEYDSSTIAEQTPNMGILFPAMRFYFLTALTAGLGLKLVAFCTFRKLINEYWQCLKLTTHHSHELFPSLLYYYCCTI